MDYKCYTHTNYVLDVCIDTKFNEKHDQITIYFLPSNSPNLKFNFHPSYFILYRFDIKLHQIRVQNHSEITYNYLIEP